MRAGARVLDYEGSERFLLCQISLLLLGWVGAVIGDSSVGSQSTVRPVVLP